MVARQRTACVLVGVALSLVGCGGSLVGASGTGGSQGSGGTGGSIGSGGTGGAPAGCAQDLSGTWDLVAESGYAGGTLNGLLVISADMLSLQLGPTTLIYQAQPTELATWQNGAGAPVRTIAITNNPSSVNSGSIPLAIGGAWSLAAGEETCAASVGAVSMIGACMGSGDLVAGGDWPSPLPIPNNGRTYTATRLTAATSQFGDLGGTWQTNADGGDGGSCTVTLIGSTVTTKCSGIVPFNGAMQLTIGSDCVASGQTGNGLAGSGFALSAQRR